MSPILFCRATFNNLCVLRGMTNEIKKNPKIITLENRILTHVLHGDGIGNAQFPNFSTSLSLSLT